MSTSQPVLELDGVEYSYRRNAALQGVPVQLKPGEVLAVTGASGCGKSTLLHVPPAFSARMRARSAWTVRIWLLSRQSSALGCGVRRSASCCSSANWFRTCSFLLAAAFMATFPATIGPLAIFLVQFGVLDTMLSLAFLLWPGTLSPNYFYKVDRPIWIWNWSKPAKAINTAAVVLSLIVAHQTGAQWLPYLIAIAACVVKVVSSYRLTAILRGRRVAVPGQP